MFGTNQIVGKSFFKKAKEEELLVTSRFFTLQGEGPYRGQPAYFIRLAKCNLSCSFCDTYFDNGDWQTFSELFAESNQIIEEFFTKRGMATPSWAHHFPRKMVLVITGGEPSLQSNLSAFLHQATHYFQTLQIESNGISVLDNMPEHTTFVVSPKCLEKGGKAIRYLKPNPSMLMRADCLKFVMAAPEDERFSCYSTIPDWAHKWSEATQKPIFISPMNKYKKEPQRIKTIRETGIDLSLEERSEINEVISFWEPNLLDSSMNQRNHEYAAEYCMKYGFILNLQLHLFASLP